MVGVPRWLRQLLAGVTVEEVQRFDAALDAAMTELERRPGTDDEPWRRAAEQDIANAETRRAAYKLEAAWSALKSAHREMTRSFDWSELVAEARVVRNEANEKLTGWRHASVAELLPHELLNGVGLVSGGLTVERAVRLSEDPGVVDRARPAAAEEPGLEVGDVADAASESKREERRRTLVDDLRNRLVEAKSVLDTHSDNVYHKYRILRRAVISTTVAYGLFLAVLVVIVALEWVPSALLSDPPEDSPLGGWRLLLVVMALGVIGAFFSSATELRSRDDKTRIPDLRVRYTLMGMRPIVGVSGAVIVIVVLQSALGEAVALQPTAIFGVAIAAGFTERLVTKTVSSAANAIS